MRNAGNDNHSSSFSSSSKIRQLQIGKHDNLNGIERRRQKLSSFAIKHDSFRFVEKVEKNLTCATVVKSQT